MDLVEEFMFSPKVADPVNVGNGPAGNRVIYEITGGEVTGDRIRGKILGGADWGIIGTDGVLRIDVRAQIETHDGAFLYLQYHGLLEVNQRLREALANGETTDFGEQYCYINPRVETGDERYSWVNNTFFVGQGRALPGGPEYRVWRAV